MKTELNQAKIDELIKLNHKLASMNELFLESIVHNDEDYVSNKYYVVSRHFDRIINKIYHILGYFDDDE